MALTPSATKETAASLAAHGASVIALDLPQGIERAQAPNGVRFVAADVASADDVQAALDGIDADAAPLRIVVNCAGIAPARRILVRMIVQHDYLNGETIRMDGGIRMQPR